MAAGILNSFDKDILHFKINSLTLISCFQSLCFRNLMKHTSWWKYPISTIIENSSKIEAVLVMLRVAIFIMAKIQFSLMLIFLSVVQSVTQRRLNVDKIKCRIFFHDIFKFASKCRRRRNTNLVVERSLYKKLILIWLASIYHVKILWGRRRLPLILFMIIRSKNDLHKKIFTFDMHTHYVTQR